LLFSCMETSSIVHCDESVPVVIITGASSGIGRCIAEIYARRHFRLVLASRSEEALSKETERCKELGSTAVIYVVCDVSKKESCKLVYCRCSKRCELS